MLCCLACMCCIHLSAAPHHKPAQHKTATHAWSTGGNAKAIEKRRRGIQKAAPLFQWKEERDKLKAAEIKARGQTIRRRPSTSSADASEDDSGKLAEAPYKVPRTGPPRMMCNRLYDQLYFAEPDPKGVPHVD